MTWRAHHPQAQCLQPRNSRETFKPEPKHHRQVRQQSHHNLHPLDQSLEIPRRRTELGGTNPHRRRSRRGHAKSPEHQPIRRQFPPLSTPLERNLPTNVEEHIPHSNPESPHGCEEEARHRTLPQNRRHPRISAQRNQLPGCTIQRKMGKRDGIRGIPAQTWADLSPVHASEPRTTEQVHPAGHASRSLRTRE